MVQFLRTHVRVEQIILILTIILLTTPTASASTKSTIWWEVVTTGGKIAYESASYVVEADVRQMNANDIFTQDEFNMPMHVEIDNESFVIGTVPLYGYDSENNDGLWNRLSHLQTALDINSDSSIEVVVNGDRCETEIVRALGGEDTQSSKKFLKMMEANQWVLLHATALPLGIAERTGDDVLYGGYLTTQSRAGGWVGCTVGISELSYSNSTLWIEPTTAPTNIGDCVENHTGVAWTSKASHPWVGFRQGITTACSDELSATFVHGTDGESGGTEFDAGPPEFLPKVGRFGSCVTTNGTHDFVFGGVSAVGDFVEDWYIRDRATGVIENKTEAGSIRTVGGSCFFEGEAIVSVGGFSSCSTSSELWVERDSRAFGKWKGPAFGGGCLAFLTEGFTIQKNKLEIASEKYPYLTSNLHATPIFSFPSLTDNHYSCANTLHINIQNSSVTEFTTELASGCQVFSSDIVLEDGSLITVGGMNRLGTVQTLMVHHSRLDLSETGLNSSIFAVLKLPRVAPVVLVDSENLTIYGGMDFSLASGPLYTTIEQFNQSTHAVYELKYGDFWIDDGWVDGSSTNGFTISLALTSMYIAAIAMKLEQVRRF